MRCSLTKKTEIEARLETSCRDFLDPPSKLMADFMPIGIAIRYIYISWLQVLQNKSEVIGDLRFKSNRFGPSLVVKLAINSEKCDWLKLVAEPDRDF